MPLVCVVAVSSRDRYDGEAFAAALALVPRWANEPTRPAEAEDTSSSMITGSLTGSGRKCGRGNAVHDPGRLFSRLVPLDAAARQGPHLDLRVVKQSSQVLVTCEDQQLVPRACELGKHLRGRLCSRDVEVHQHVVHHHRQTDPSSGISADQRQPQTEKDLLACAAAQHMDRQSVAIGVVDIEGPTPERGPNAAITASGQFGEIG